MNACVISAYCYKSDDCPDELVSGTDSGSWEMEFVADLDVNYSCGIPTARTEELLFMKPIMNCVRNCTFNTYNLFTKHCQVYAAVCDI